MYLLGLLVHPNTEQEGIFTLFMFREQEITILIFLKTKSNNVEIFELAISMNNEKHVLLA
jgi:hypothetical protein